MYRKVIILFLVVTGYMDCIAFVRAESEKKDTCSTSRELENIIMRFINYSDKAIYEKEFLAAFARNNENKECYFPRTEWEKRIYFFLGDSSLVQELQTDERAMALLIDLYLLNQNNTELTGYYGSKAIPKAVTRNPEAFIKVLYGKTESEANQCISTLLNLKQRDTERVKKELSNLGKEEYLPVVNKIKQTLQ